MSGFINRKGDGRERAMIRLDQAAVGFCLLLWVVCGCAPQTDSNEASLDLSGQVLLEGEDDHGGIGVRVAFDDGALVGQGLTGADGFFVFRNVPQRSFRLTFSKEVFDTQTDVVALFDGSGFVINEGQTVTLRPDRSAAISGQLDSPLVVDDWNVSATITLSGNGPAVSFAPDGDGEFARGDLRPGNYALEVKAQGHLTYSTVVSIGSGQTLVLEQAIVMTPEGQSPETAVVLRGRVILDGSPDSSGVLVRVEIGDELFTNTTTDEEGFFAIQTSRVVHTLSFSKEGHRSPAGQSSEIAVRWNEEALRFEVDGQPVDEEVFRLEPLPVASLSGLVASAQGGRNDWPNIGFVSLVNVQERRIAPITNADGGQGQFQFVGLEPGPYTLNIAAQGHLPFSRDVVLAEGGNSTQGLFEQAVVVLEPEPVVVLRGAVRLQGQDGDVEDHSGVQIQATVGDNILVATLQTGVDGNYAFLATRQNHTLQISRPGFVSREIDVFWDEVDGRFEVGEEPFDALEFDLSRSPAEGVIRVVVAVEPSWIPEAQRHINLSIFGPNHIAARQQVFHNADDAAQPEVFSEIPEGTFVVQASRPGFGTVQQTVTLRPGADDEEVSLTVTLESLAVSRLDLDQHPMTTEDFEEAVALGIDMTLANLSGVIMPAQDLSGVEGLVLKGVNFGNADLRGANLSGLDLAQANFFGADLGCFDEERCTTLAGADLSRAIVSSANLSGASFVQPDEPIPAESCDVDAPRPAVKLDGAVFSQTDLRGVDLRGVYFAQGALSGSLLQGANLSGACLREASLVLTNLREANLAGADLSEATLFNSIFFLADLSDARLVEAELTGANLVGADLSRVDATEASLLSIITGATQCANEQEGQCSTTLDDATFDRAVLVGVLFINSTLHRASFVGADMRLAEFVDSNSDEVDFTEAQLQGANFRAGVFQRSSFRDADLQQANLETSNFFGSDLSNVNLQRANLNQALWHETNLRGALFDNTRDMFGAEFTCADMRGAQFMFARLEGGNLERVNLDGANIYSGIFFGGTSFIESSFNNATINGLHFDGVAMRRTSMTNVRFQAVSANDANFCGANLTGSSFVEPRAWVETNCPNGTNSSNANNSCEGHLSPTCSSAPLNRSCSRPL